MWCSAVLFVHVGDCVGRPWVVVSVSCGVDCVVRPWVVVSVSCGVDCVVCPWVVVSVSCGVDCVVCPWVVVCGVRLVAVTIWLSGL